MPVSEKQISRLGGVSDAGGDEILDGLFAHIIAKRGRLLNIHQVVAHSPKMLRAQAAYTSALREDSMLSRDLQELLILRAAQVNNSHYEQTVHRPIAIACGVPVGKIDALADWQRSTLYEATERAALAFVDQAAARGDVDDVVFDALREHFSPRETVELAALVGWYVGNSRFVRALQIAPEGGSE